MSKYRFFFLYLFFTFLLFSCSKVPVANDSSVAAILENRIPQEICWYQKNDEKDSYEEFVEQLLCGDLSISSAVQIALLNNPNIQSAFEEMGISHADLIQAGLFQNPAFDIVYRFPDRKGFKNNIEYSIVTSFLDIFLIPLRKKVAQAEWEQAQLKVAKIVLDLAFEVEKTFYMIQSLQEQHYHFANLEELSFLTLELTQKQFEAGNVNIFSLEASHLQQAEAQIVCSQNQLNLIEQREKMTRLLGLFHSSMWNISTPLPLLPDKEIDLSCVDEIALSERLDLQIAKWEIYKLESLFPLKSWWSFTDAKIGFSSEREPESVTVSGPALSLAIPLFNYGQAEREKLDAMVKQAHERHRALEIQVLAEVHEVMERLHLNRKISLAYQEQLLPLQARILEFSADYYHVMAKSVFNLLQAQQQAIQTQIKAKMALRDYWMTRADLDRSLDGKLFLAQEDFPFEAVNHAMIDEKPLEDEIAHHQEPNTNKDLPYTPVITPNGSTLPWKLENGVKVFHLIAEKIQREFAPGLIVNCWGYNGLTPGPTIEVVEGDRVKILVTNKLPESTTVHWHGLLLPNGMDGVTGLNQPPIHPGETFCYEFTAKNPGTHLYHPHFDETTQIAMGMMGFFIIHPKEREEIDRDFAIMLHEWFIPIGGATPDPIVMTDFNYFTFNSTVWPGTQSLVVKEDERVRIRFGNLSMNSHPIHLHGYEFVVTSMGASRIPLSAQYTAVTVNVPVGDTRNIEFVANAPGDWALHCHKSHHTMNGMEHNLPNLIGIDQKEIAEKIRKFIPDYMPMGQSGMGDMFSMHHGKRPPNYLPFGSPGQFGTIEMSGMFTVLKVRKEIENDADPGWYENPEGTVAGPCNEKKSKSL